MLDRQTEITLGVNFKWGLDFHNKTTNAVMGGSQAYQAPRWMPNKSVHTINKG